MREALAYSLNVPAVETLKRIGASAFEAKLTSVGAVLVRPRTAMTDPGLALALGGAGISLRDLAMLYAALADGGVAKPLAWTEAEAKAHAGQPGRRLVSAEAASAVLDILRESPPPPGRAPRPLAAGASQIAFKTGTSYGFRDAVAVGVGGGHVVAVWTGRPDGGARAGRTGREAALPLVFDAFDVLGAGPDAPRSLTPTGAPPALQGLSAEAEGPA